MGELQDEVKRLRKGIEDAVRKANAEWEVDHDRGWGWVAVDEIAALIGLERPNE